MLCLVNRERRERGRAPVRFQRRLGRAATRHARDMVRRRYFSHISPSGAQVTDRVRASGYLRAGSRYVVGENLAWGTEARATPRATVEAWMRSGSHRLVLLHPRFREFGVGLARGVPIARHSDAPSPATWVLLLGALD